MILGLNHRHKNNDIIISKNWEGLVDGLGLEVIDGIITKKINFEKNPQRTND